MQTLRLLHDDGEAYIVSIVDRTRDICQNAVFRSHADGAARIAAENQAGKDAYIKHGVFDGEKYKSTGAPICTLKHVQGSRTFVIDVDGKDVGGDADAALAAFHKVWAVLQPSGMPAPNVVNQTGHGVHVAWVLDEVVPIAEWQQATNTLFGMLKGHGLALDPGMKPADRGLRACGPGILNYSDPDAAAPTAEVTIGAARIPAAAWRAWIAQYANITPLAKPTKPAPGGVNAEYGLAAEYAPFSLIELIPECEILSSALSTGGAEHNYLEWTQLIAQASKHANEVEARNLAHSFSRVHPDYDGAKVDEKFNSFVTAKVNGVVTCAKMAEASPRNAEMCGRCQYHGKINSIAAIPGLRPAQAIPDKQLPNPSYVNTGVGLVLRLQGQEDRMVWANHHLWDVQSLEQTPDGETTLRFKVSTVNGVAVRNDARLVINTLADTKAVRSAFTEMGCMLGDTEGRLMHGAVKSFVEQLRSRGAVIRVYKNLGWSDDRTAFSLGDATVTKDETVEMIRRPGHEDFGLHGDEAEFQQLLAYILDGEQRPEAHALVASSLAAPLLCMTGVKGLFLNFWSTESSRGKSTLMALAGSFWGKPTTGGNDDTNNALITRMAKLRHLPQYYDELPKGVDLAEFVIKMVMRIPSGTGKRRLNVNSEEQKAGEWQTLMVAATNRSTSSILGGDKTQGDAVQARYLDVHMPQLEDMALEKKPSMDKKKARLDMHNGFVGRAFAEYIVRNQEQIDKRIDDFRDKLARIARVTADDTSGRMHVAAGAAMITAAEVARLQGIVPQLNPHLVARAVQAALLAAKEDRKTAQGRAKPRDIISDYFHQMLEFRLIVTRRDLKSDIVQLKYSHVRPRFPTAYEINTTDNIVIIDLEEFDKFLRAQSHNATDVYEALKAYSQEPYPFGNGTEWEAVAPRRAVRIPVKGSPWERQLTKEPPPPST